MQHDEQLRKELLAEVETVAPILAEHAPESEKLGRLDGATIDALNTTRLLRLTCPRELGGDEADPITQLLVLEALARIDASVSWVVGIIAGSTGFAVAAGESRKNSVTGGLVSQLRGGCGKEPFARGSQ